MPKIVISLDGAVLKEVTLIKDRTSFGRRPYNDVVIDHLAVSGEHAVVQMLGSQACIEDLNSTNGTYVNGKSVKKQPLNNEDVVEIGKYRIQYLDEARPAAASLASAASALLRVMSGASAGREMALVKDVTTLGKPGVAVAAISRSPQGFVLAPVEGASLLLLNGVPLSVPSIKLANGDLIELAGTQMQFVQA
ncbi:MAG: FHA domain-containing protein [Polaromonas sp.]